MGTTTARLGLYKPLDDGSELVNVQTDLNGNTDKLDLAPGFQVVTSSTRPSSPFSGKAIAESDTSYRTYFSNGTSPASASWVEIPNGSGTYNSNLALASGKQISIAGAGTLAIAGAGSVTIGAGGQINIGASGSTASLAVVNSTAGIDLISGRVTGDTQSRWIVDTDGTLNWGAGASASVDTNLYRSAANTLKTDDSLIVGTDLTVSGSASVTGNLTGASNLNMGAWTTYTPAWGAESGTQPAIGNGTIVGRYQRIGRTINYLIEIVTGSTTTYGDGGASGNYYFSLPAAPASAWDGKRTPRTIWRDNSASAHYSGAGIITTANHANGSIYRFTVDDGTSSAAFWDSVAPFTMAQADSMTFTGTYEAAS